MSQYTKSTNFATKDNLTPGDPLKVVRGTEIDTEFNNIATAVATKTDNSAAAITGGSITGITDLAVADGGTGASTATAALNNLLPSQTGNANKYLQTDGTNATWDAVSLSTADITGTLPVANGGTGVTSSTGTGSVVLSNSPTLVTPALGTPASGVATNLTGLPISTGVSGLGTGVATFLGTPSSANLASAVSDETGTGSLVFANSPTLVTPALGTPSALVGTNITGTASGLTAGNVTTNANLTGAVTSVGNATSLGSFSSANLLGALTDETGTGSAVFATSPTLVTPILGTPTSATLTNATGLPIATGVSGLGTGVATALAVNVGSAGAPVVNGGVLGTPSSGTATNLTGLPLTTGVTGTLPVANGGTNLTSFTSGGVVYASSTSALATGSALTFDGSALVSGTSIRANSFMEVRSNTAIMYWENAANTLWWAQKLTGSDFAWDHYNGSTVAEQMRLTSTGLGIGTSSPFASPKLTVFNSATITTGGDGGGNGVFIAASTGSASGGQLVVAGSDTAAIDKGGAIVFAGKWDTATSDIAQWAKIAGYKENATNNNFSGYLGFYTRANGGAATERMRLDSAGNLGLGTAPSATSSGVKSFELQAVGSGLVSFGSVDTVLTAGAFYSSTGWKYAVSGSAVSKYYQSAGKHQWFNAASGTAGNAISFTQAMTLTADGYLLVGMTTNTRDTTSGAVAFGFNGTSQNGLLISDTGTGSGSNIPVVFGRNGSVVGSIVTTTTGTTYNSGASDYRLKDNIENLDGGLQAICNLRPVKFKWKSNGKSDKGFIAHELQQIIPECISGEKDAIDENEKPIYQQISTSTPQMIAMLVSAIQELKMEFDTYKAAHP